MTCPYEVFGAPGIGSESTVVLPATLGVVATALLPLTLTAWL